MENKPMLKELIFLIIRKITSLEKEMTCCGLTISQSRALLEIGKSNEISLIELADRLSLDKSTMSRTVNSLVESGQVERLPDRENRRYVILKLTTEGKKLHKQIQEAFESFCDEVLAQIPEDRREQVDQSILMLYKSISGIKCCE